MIRQPTCRLALLALLHAVLLQLTAARSLQQRLDLSRRTATARAQEAPAIGLDSVEGTEIILVLNPPKGDERPSDEAVEALKFAVANEAMRPLPLQTFLSKYGMNPKARLPPLHTITPGAGTAEGAGAMPLNMETTAVAAAAPAPAPPPEVPQLFHPIGYDTTGPPGPVAGFKGDLRQSLTTAAPPFDPAWKGPTNNDILGYGLGGSIVGDLQACKDTCRDTPPCQAIQYSPTDRWKGNNCFIFEFQRKQFVVSSPKQQFESFQIWKYDRSLDPLGMAAAAAPAAAPGPAMATTTQMMMVSEDAYATASVRALTNMVRLPNGDVLECSQCQCVKRVNGGVEEMPDPTCQ